MGLITSISSVKSSHPSRVRGLKHGADHVDLKRQVIAPFTGAWIETGDPDAPKAVEVYRTLHGCVD